MVLEAAPEAMPDVVDNTPKPCPECERVNDQDMVKMTVRDFVAVKKKLIQQSDYANYLLDIFDGLKAN